MATETGQAGWRQRWANKQNERRRHAFDVALSAWQRDDDQAQWMLAAAREFQGLPAEQLPPHVLLGRGETALLVLPGAVLLELSDQPVLPAPGHASFSAFPAPAGPSPAGRIVDGGVAVVTSRRVMLYGNHRREWSYAKLIGLAHLPDNRTTLMRVDNRVKVSGLSVEPTAAAGLRFNLALALADFAGDRLGFVAHLERQAEDHQQRRPQPPIPATPRQAPFTARFGPVAITAAAVAAVLLLCGVVAALAAPSGSQGGDAAESGSTTQVQPPSTAPAASPSQVPPASAAPASVAAPSVAAPRTPARTPAGKASPKPTTSSPTPKAVSLCGAPANPYGYNYCGRGSRVSDPKPDICDYFDCIDNFSNGKGYMIECDDSMVSMSGGRPGSCSSHGGNKRTVYDG